jgi:anti-sigma regulatory factor (Ser/Thr protein kinase)
MEALTSSLQSQLKFSINHSSDISAVRRAGDLMARNAEFSEVRSGQLAIVITETATNMLKHAKDGVCLLSPIFRNGMHGVEVLATDCGPGISDLAFSSRDGVSTVGTAGTGLGAIQRLTDEFDFYSMPGKGAAFSMRFWPTKRPDPAAVEFGAVCVPIPSEEECGDGWAVLLSAEVAHLLVVDGLGHGPDAAIAARCAIESFSKLPHAGMRALIEASHSALRPTRGAAIAVAELNCSAETFTLAGIGNISACVIDGAARKQLVSHNGIVGHNVRKIQEFTIPCPTYSLSIMASDGINTQWDLAAYPGLSSRAPGLIAAILLRDFSRGRDDATVLVARFTGHSAS